MENCLLCRRRDKAFNRIPGQLPKCGMSPANDICLNLGLGHLQPRIVLGMGSLGSGEWADHPNHCRWKLTAIERDIHRVLGQKSVPAVKIGRASWRDRVCQYV